MVSITANTSQDFILLDYFPSNKFKISDAILALTKEVPYYTEFHTIADELTHESYSSQDYFCSYE